MLQEFWYSVFLPNSLNEAWIWVWAGTGVYSSMQQQSPEYANTPWSRKERISMSQFSRRLAEISYTISLFAWDYQPNQPASQQCFSLTENLLAVLSASQINPSEQTECFKRSHTPRWLALRRIFSAYAVTSSFRGIWLYAMCFPFGFFSLVPVFFL
jgi:hypothetical protein